MILILNRSGDCQPVYGKLTAAVTKRSLTPSLRAMESEAMSRSPR